MNDISIYKVGQKFKCKPYNFYTDFDNRIVRITGVEHPGTYSESIRFTVEGMGGSIANWHWYKRDFIKLNPIPLYTLNKDIPWL